ncbi:MAG: PHP domain-containing protein [Clostridiales bacterium]|nr:PHP domain-containing protein [Clostridiales bacterium]
MPDWIDLHVHTLASDGSDTPADVVRMAVELGLRAVAVTDHDTFAGLPEAIEAGARYGVEVVPGVELSTIYDGVEVHVLGYYMDAGHPRLRAMMARATAERNARNETMVQRLHDAGYPVTMDALHAEFPGQTMLGRPHISEYLMRHGYVASVQDGMKNLLGRGKPFYVARYNIPLEESVETLRAAGGLPVVAHLFKYRYTPEQLTAMVDAATAAGAVGLEAMYTNYTPAQEQAVRVLAAERGLLCTGGTDYHGARKPDIALGRGFGNLRVPYALLEGLKEYDV